MSSRQILARAWPLGWGMLLAAVILGPALFLPGYTLRGDMVFVPHQPWKSAWLGLDGSAPRAVPMDALVSLATYVVPGWVVQRVALAGPLVLAVLGADRLLRATVGERGRDATGVGWPARLATMTLYVWNPWVAERLLIGQWALVAGYALLPWVALAAVRTVDDRRSGWPRLAVALGLAAVTSPPGGVMAVGVAVLAAACLRSWRAVLTAVGLGVLLNLPWLVPSVLLPGHLASGGRPFALFAARAESGLGLLPSLLSLGGIWKSVVVPEARTQALVVALAGGLSLVAATGLWMSRGRSLVRATSVVGLVAVVVAYVPALPAVSRLLDADGLTVLAFFRDSDRFLAPLALPLALGVGLVVEKLVRNPGVGSARESAAATAAAVITAAPILLLPGLAWGVGGALSPATYPRDWDAVADRIGASGGGATVVLPWTGSYRGFGWNEHRAGLDPAPRALPGEVIIDDRVLVNGAILPAESSRAARVGHALAQPDPGLRAKRLHDLGVRWVLVEAGQGVDPSDLPAGRRAINGADLTLIDLGAGGRAGAIAR